MSEGLKGLLLFSRNCLLRRSGSFVSLPEDKCSNTEDGKKIRVRDVLVNNFNTVYIERCKFMKDVLVMIERVC
jgi:hypothetical protein